MTSDFEGFSIPDVIHYIFFPNLIIQKEYFPFNVRRFIFIFKIRDVLKVLAIGDIIQFYFIHNVSKFTQNTQCPLEAAWLSG